MNRIGQIILICCLLLDSNSLFAQRRFTAYPLELWAYTGPATFSGDVPSGLFQSAKTFADWKPSNANFSLGGGLHYRFARQWETKQTLTLLQFAGSDQWFKNLAYRERNLSFRTRALEWSSLLIWSPIHWDVQGRNRHHHIYAGTGWTVLFFSPQAELNGTYHKLRPLGTEGQGLEIGKNTYAKASLNTAFVGGYRYKLNRQYVIGLELNLRKSFSDYLDDVSGTYTNNETLREKRGDVAADLADRNLSGTPKAQGSSRGNPGAKDNYGSLLFTFAWFVGS